MLAESHEMAEMVDQTSMSVGQLFQGITICVLQLKDVLPSQFFPPGWFIYKLICTCLRGHHNGAVAPGALAEMLGPIDVMSTTSDWNVCSLADFPHV